jgi:hypothetical protein
MKPDETYDARISKGVHHVWVSLLDKEWFEMDMAEFTDEPELLASICQLIGGEPRSAIVLDANNVRGSKILAVQFTALCAEHYPCVVLQAAGDVLFSGHEVLKLRDAGKGFDGYTWERANSRRSFSWDGLWMWDEPEDPLQDQMLAGPDLPDGRDRKQLGA